MTDDQTNLVLEHLRHIRGKVDRIADDVQDLKIRVTALEEGMAGVHQGLAGINRRLDRLDERVERIERRLELTEA